MLSGLAKMNESAVVSFVGGSGEPDPAGRMRSACFLLTATRCPGCLKQIHELLETLNESLPGPARVSVHANGRSIIAKSEEERGPRGWGRSKIGGVADV